MCGFMGTSRACACCWLLLTQPLLDVIIAAGLDMGPPIRATGSDPAARRLPLGNLINRSVGVAVALAFLPAIGRWMVTVEPDPARS